MSIKLLKFVGALVANGIAAAFAFAILWLGQKLGLTEVEALAVLIAFWFSNYAYSKETKGI